MADFLLDGKRLTTCGGRELSKIKLVSVCKGEAANASDCTLLVVAIRLPKRYECIGVSLSLRQQSCKTGIQRARLFQRDEVIVECSSSWSLESADICCRYYPS
jgi:hypothetical protein